MMKTMKLAACSSLAIMTCAALSEPTCARPTSAESARAAMADAVRGTEDLDRTRSATRQFDATINVLAGATYNFQLSPGDLLASGSVPGDRFVYLGQAGERLTFTVRSDAVDPILVLNGPNEFFVANDDAPGMGLNAQIVTTLPQDCRYEMAIGTAPAGQTGPYSLQIEQGGSGPQTVTNAPTPVVATASQPTPAPTVTRISAGQWAEGNLVAGDTTLSDGSYADIFSLEGRAGQRLTITLQSTQFDANLIMVGPSNFAQSNDDDPGMGNNSRLDVTLPQDGTYIINANAFFPNTGGAYRLEVRLN